MIKNYLRNILDGMSDKYLKSALRRQYLEDKILNYKGLGVSTEKYCDRDIIVSLTTYGKRLNYVCFAVESIMQQTTKANKIVLWLGEKDYDGTIPSPLKLQTQRGLEIRRTKDIRSYTKIIPSLMEFPNAAIVTVDDDIIYDFDILGRMIDSYLCNRDSINACRCHVMQYGFNGKIKPYNKWKSHSFDYQNNNRNFFTGVGGVLYPPHCFDDEVFNEQVFMDICKSADDVWLNAMARKTGTKICKVPTNNVLCEDFVEMTEVQDIALRKINVNKRLNDKQIVEVWGKYKIPFK